MITYLKTIGADLGDGQCLYNCSVWEHDMTHTAMVYVYRIRSIRAVTMIVFGPTQSFKAVKLCVSTLYSWGKYYLC